MLDASAVDRRVQPGDEGREMSEFAIKPVSPSERAAWESLWHGYLRFYESSQAHDATDVLWQRLHDPNEPMHLLGAYHHGKLVGFVHYLYHRSCWTVGDYCYLQDLFVVPEARGFGAGRALIEAVYEAAKAAGASRVHWLTQEGNAQARALYDRLADRSGFIQYRKLF
jgi:GNAT superfamily N-acetyltransferase